MLVINKTSVTVHHKKVRSKNSMEEKKTLFFGIAHDSDIFIK